jgi:hypothetical protein
MDNISLEGEVWKDVPWYEGLYKVSNLWRVYSFYLKGISKITVEKIWGYWFLWLSKKWVSKTFKIHRLVCLVFIPNPENKPQVNHKNWIKLDNRVENLEWCTNWENQIHAYKTWLKVWAFKWKLWASHNKSKTTYQFDRNGNLLNVFWSASEAARYMNKSRTCITDCCRWKQDHAFGYVWKYTEK